ncbi:MAG: sigma-70 family RNA polymerase sigma factor [Isosphaerales bacterium]
MIVFDSQKNEVFWRGLLDCPQARVLSAVEERRLLVELDDCKQRILEAIPRPTETEWNRSARGSEFQQLVRDLANPATRHEPLATGLGPLARRYQEIRSKLVMANVRLVAHIAKRYQGRGVPPGDLIQEGICALLVAIDRFDLVNPTRLATYAIWWIRQGVQRAVATGAYPVRLNAKHLRQMARAHDGSTEGQWDAPAFANPPAPARSQTLERLLAAARPTLSLDAPSRHDGTTAVVDFLSALDEEVSETEEINESVGKMIETLDPREQVVVNLRFGLSGKPRHTLVQVGHVLGVSKERVRQIQARAMRKLRTA